MAVQAQYPSNVLLADYRKRPKPVLGNDSLDFTMQNHTPTGAVDDSHHHHQQQLPHHPHHHQQQQQHQQFLPQVQPIVAANLLRMYTAVAGLNHMAPQPKTNMAELEASTPAHPRKRLREDDDLARQALAAAMLPPFPDILPNNLGAQYGGLHMGAIPISTGLRLAFDDSRSASTTPSTSGRVLPSFSSICNDAVQAQLLKQKDEIDQIINAHGERMKHYFEERRQFHTLSVLTIIEDSLLKKLSEKEEEIERTRLRNRDLEEQVKHLMLESQLWQNLAQSNEVMVSSLRSSLEQVVAQSREQSKEGCGENGGSADDAESCNLGESGGFTNGHFVVENKDQKEFRNCRVCQRNGVSVLILPCRHLCLCKECDVRQATCPICGATKNASVQVHMD